MAKGKTEADGGKAKDNELVSGGYFVSPSGTVSADLRYFRKAFKGDPERYQYLKSQLHGQNDDPDEENTWAKAVKWTIEGRDLTLIRRYDALRAEFKAKKTESNRIPDALEIKDVMDVIGKLIALDVRKPPCDIASVRAELDASNYGMEEVKEAVLRFITMKKNAPGYSGKSICLVGPAGTGKTSIAKAIAKAMDCGFYKYCAGGLNDSFSLKGVSKEYHLAHCGQIVKGLIASGSRTPVFVIDEVDKMAHDNSNGDPAAVLLEVLDCQQSREFVDAFIDVPIDVSGVLFILTANDESCIPAPLLDRLEMIRVPGYSMEEKQRIAEDYVLPKLMDLMRKGVSVPLFPKKLIGQMVCGYCLTPGVRDVEENMTRMVFGYQSDVLQGKRAAEHEFTVYDILRYLGPSVQSVLRRIDGDGCVGFVNALCVFDALDFGSLLSVEAVRMPGSGKLVLTGGIGDSMKESAFVAFSYMRMYLKSKGVQADGSDCHVNFPDGYRKDGGSAGLAIACAMYSCFMDIPAKKGIALTGGISLMGFVIRVGGIRQKIQAAVNAGMKQIILPEGNKGDVLSVWKDGDPGIKVVYVSSAEELFGTMFPQGKAHARQTMVDRRIVPKPLRDTGDGGT